MARIIRLSSTIRQEKQKSGHRDGVDDSLLRDAAGSFDNFDAFDLEELEASSGETTSSRKKVVEKPPSKEENFGEFFRNRLRHYFGSCDLTVHIDLLFYIKSNCIRKLVNKKSFIDSVRS
ncbi:hypothetical protein KIN20_022243 [Parelaphostrongylus tenuis]|uniref:Uncharacterized protein n=1 Tax=Parelaphostrongylus tenuis TaxID=148309 RepID=A0AAD5NBH4_PARTN|nr:hypothetical protein KIN20_022243 [Parelaphostrongylus tenuis]